MHQLILVGGEFATFAKRPFDSLGPCQSIDYIWIK
jgi:hypothetical protein